MEKVQVSVITIVRNDLQNIGNTMLSVLNQTYAGVEYVVKDGMSTDGTWEIIQNTAKKYTNKHIRHMSCSDTGIYDAMNQAVCHSNGEWIIFINSGDAFYSQSTLSEIFESGLEYRHKGILYGNAIVRDEAGDAVWKSDIKKIEKKMPFCHQSCFIRRELLLRYPFSTKYRIVSDYNNILELYQAREQFYDLNRIVSIFQLDGVSSTDFVRRFREREAVRHERGLKCSFQFLYPFGLLINYIKMFVIRYVPHAILIRLKKWYKRHVKRYELIGREDRGIDL